MNIVVFTVRQQVKNSKNSDRKHGELIWVLIIQLSQNKLLKLDKIEILKSMELLNHAC